MKIEYSSVPQSVSNIYLQDAKKRGYSEELTKDYTQDRAKVYKKNAPLGDAVFLATALATAGKIIYDARKGGIKFLKAATEQFKPFYDQTEKSFTSLNAIDNLKISNIAKLGKSIVEGVKLSGRSILGLCKSIPKPIGIPAAIALGLLTIKGISENNKVDTKYDTLKYLEEKQKI